MRVVAVRDLLAGLVALGLIVAALSLATTLHFYRRRRLRAHESERALGRRIIAELPTAEELVLFSEDASSFHYGAQAIDKNSIAVVRVLINGSQLASTVSKRHAVAAAAQQPTSFEDRPEGIARDRWDVAIETTDDNVRNVQTAGTLGTVLVECGAIRERVSQELARSVYDAVRLDIERRDASR